MRVEMVYRVLNAANKAEIISERTFEAAEQQFDELIRLAEIGLDYEYLSKHEEVAGLPTIEDIQKLAKRRRKQEANK